MKKYLTLLTRSLHAKTLKDGILFSLFSFVNKGFKFFLILLLANYITPSEYGYLNLYMTVCMIVSYIAALSIEGYITVAYFKEGEDGLRNAFSCVLCLSLVMLLFLSLFIVCLGDTISETLALNSFLMYLAVIGGFFGVFDSMNLNYLRIRERVGMYGLVGCSNALINFVVSIILVKVFLYSWYGCVYAQLLCAVTFGIIGLSVFLFHGYIVKPKWEYMKSMLLWGIPLIPHHATVFIRQGLDRYIINSTHTIEDVGLFSFALNLANIVSMIGMAFNQSNSIDIYKILGNKEMSVKEKISHLKRMRKFFVVLYIVISVISAASCFFIVPFLLPKYEGSVRYILILTFFAFLSCLYLVYTNYLFYFEKTKQIMQITFFSSLVHLLLSLWLTRYSLYLTAIVYVISQLIIVFFIRHQSLRILSTSNAK